jgi:hypothetical protein
LIALSAFVIALSAPGCDEGKPNAGGGGDSGGPGGDAGGNADGGGPGGAGDGAGDGGAADGGGDDGQGGEQVETPDLMEPPAPKMPDPRPLDAGSDEVEVAVPGELLEDPAEGATDFISDDPNASIEDMNNRGADDEAEPAAGAEGDQAAGGGGAAREIEEADILKVEGDTLFALSQYRGLVTIDVSDPEDLSVLGRYASEGIPFEMYVRDGVAYALYSSFWGYDQDPETGNVVWRQSSRVLAVDVSDPLNPFEIGGFDVPGGISDSRIVGDILYVVSYENGWCWGCNDGEPRTTVTSLSVADPANMEVVDQLAFVEDGQSWGWRRSIHVTTERMYVSGLTWGGDWDSSHSTIQIVDISDPEGDMELGASRPLAGQIRSRW